MVKKNNHKITVFTCQQAKAAGLFPKMKSIKRCFLTKRFGFRHVSKKNSYFWKSFQNKQRFYADF